MNLLLTSLAPILWGTTYWVTTELLPPHRPLLAATLRALPVGLVFLASTRQLPRGEWIWKSLILGVLNIGAFFALLFVAAYRLPGGVAAFVGGVGPLMVAGFSQVLLQEKPSRLSLVAGLVGVFGVGLLVWGPIRLDTVGLLAAVGCNLSMALGIVLSRRWGNPVSMMAYTGWQLVSGGVILSILCILFEGFPATLSSDNLLGYAYLAAAGTGLAYVLWFRGIARIGASVSFLGLLSPLTATVVGFVFLGQRVSLAQMMGILVIIGGVFLGQRPPRKTILLAKTKSSI